MFVRFVLRILTGQIANKPDCPVKNRTPDNPICRPLFGEHRAKPI